ncbi:MAG: chemotaxis protein CheW [Thauera sp.]|nr:chemotaxis protein CheW [Thauera sp.]
MLYLLLRMGGGRYALEARRIVEVVPMVEFRPLPHAAPYVAGMFDYRGVVVPVIDLCRLATSNTCRALLTTRIVLVDYPGHDGTHRVLGLLAEQVTETVKLRDDDFQPPGIDVPEAPYLGELTRIDGEMVQHLAVERLLPEDLREQLFRECV